MARINYRGWNLPDGTEIPDVPADLQRLVDSTILNVPRYIGQGVLPSAQDAPQNSAWADLTPCRVTVTLNEQHMLKVSCYISATVITATVTSPNAGISVAPSVPLPAVNVLRVLSAPVPAPVPLSTTWSVAGSIFLHQAAGTQIYGIAINGGGATGTVRFNGGTGGAAKCVLTVEDFGVLV